MDNSPYSILLEFEVTPENFRKTMVELRPSRQYTSLLIAVLFLCLTVWNYSSHGLDWTTVFFLLFALYHGIPGLRERLFWRLFATICRIPKTRIRIKIDEERIVTEILSDDSKFAKEEAVRWEEFTDSGSVSEMKSWFALESKPRFPLSPRHGVWIPKSAFASEDDLNSFRAFLKEKMGELFKPLHE